MSAGVQDRPHLDVVLSKTLREAVKPLPAKDAAKVGDWHVIPIYGVGVVLTLLGLRMDRERSEFWDASDRRLGRGHGQGKGDGHQDAA